MRTPLNFSVLAAYAVGACAIASCAPSIASSGSPAAARAPGATHTTSSALTGADLRARLFAFAHDSMMGRAPGDPSNFKATAYIAAEFARFGLKPAGENGTWFQTVPLYRRTIDRRESLRINGYTAQPGVDYAPQPNNARYRPVDGATVVYAGLASDSTTWIDASVAMGKVLLFSVEPPERRTSANRRTNLVPLLNSARFRGATTLFVAELDAAGSEVAAGYLAGTVVLDTAWREILPTVLVTNAFAARLLGRPIDGATAGMTGQMLQGSTRVRVFPLELSARNVVAVLEGTDSAMRGQYVSLSAHNDHVGYNRTPVDHDSLRAFNTVVRPMGADSPNRPATAADHARVRTVLDSLRRSRPARPDSILNGADDDGSGTVALLEIAELLASGQRPRRSILFVSHTAEEMGLTGSAWFTDHPTVPRDSIVGEIDIDMIGRGGANDQPGGGPTYLEVVGLKRLSTEFGESIEASNRRQTLPFVFNMTFDAPGHPQQYYCRADHYSYARYGIPSVSISRGAHVDYHQVTDEPEYINYESLARVATMVKDGVWDLAMRLERPKLDKPKGDPRAPCRQ